MTFKSKLVIFSTVGAYIAYRVSKKPARQPYEVHDDEVLRALQVTMPDATDDEIRNLVIDGDMKAPSGSFMAAARHYAEAKGYNAG